MRVELWMEYNKFFKSQTGNNSTLYDWRSTGRWSIVAKLVLPFSPDAGGLVTLGSLLASSVGEPFPVISMPAAEPKEEHDASGAPPPFASRSAYSAMPLES